MALSQERIDYHLHELEIAQNPQSPDYVMPAFTEEDRAILDLGCGIGQTLLVAGRSNSGKMLVGLDPDLESVAYGSGKYPHLNFVNGAGESLPFQSESFDLVISRVALPYTDIRRTLREVRRVLKPSGKVWLTLHPLSMTLDYLKKAVLNLEIKRVVLGMYVIANGALFHFVGRQFRFPVDRRLETFQTESAMTREMKSAGFANIAVKRNRHFLMTAQKTA